MCCLHQRVVFILFLPVFANDVDEVCAHNKVLPNNNLFYTQDMLWETENMKDLEQDSNFLVTFPPLCTLI